MPIRTRLLPYLLPIVAALAWTTLGSQFALSQAPQPTPELYDAANLPEVVARVNDHEITGQQLLSEARGAQAQLAARGDRRVMDRMFFADALEQMIAGELLFQAARSEGLGATPSEVDAEVARRAAAFPSPEAFRQAMAAENIDEAEFRLSMEQELSIARFVRERIRPSIPVSEEEVVGFYEDNQARMQRPEQVLIRHILFDTEGADEAQKAIARNRAEAALLRLQAGEDFAALAAELSDDPTGESGGELPWLQKGETLPAFEELAFSLEPGEISPILETPIGFHILQGVDKRPEGVPDISEVRDTLIEIIRDRKMMLSMRAQVAALEEAGQVERFLP